MTQARRRIDRILDPAYADALTEVEADELRRRLNEAREVENELSFVRRLLHGKEDILRAEVERRKRADAGLPSELVRHLAEALSAGGVAGASRGARPGLPSDAAQTAGRRRVERVLSEAQLARLPETSPDEIAAAVERLRAAEREVSDERRRVHAVIDALTAELMQRYKAGLAPPI